MKQTKKEKRKCMHSELPCAMSAVIPACELQHIKSIDALHIVKIREFVVFPSRPLLLGAVRSAHCHAFITAA